MHLTSLCFLTLCLLVWLGNVSAMDYKRRLVNRPSEEEIFGIMRNRRYDTEYNVKGRQNPVLSTRSQPMRSIEKNLRKGEYVHDGKVHRLKPGEIPRGCGGMCQHPIDLNPKISDYNL